MGAAGEKAAVKTQPARSAGCSIASANVDYVWLVAELSLAPFVRGRKKVDDLVDLADPIVCGEPDTIEWHSFPPGSRAEA